jgi:predicted AAA+ superfamily ATPase
MTTLSQLLAHSERLLTRVESLLPKIVAPPSEAPQWNACAFQWRMILGKGQLVPVRHIHRIHLNDLLGIDRQKQRLLANTRQFMAGRPANHALLTGARGTGKSSLVKAVFNACQSEHHNNLRLIELDRDGLKDLPNLTAVLCTRRERFLLFCDDLSFEPHEPGYKALKSALDGSIAALPDHVLIYATSNRRHLMPQSFVDNLNTTREHEGEIHPGESTEEKISLSDRFGLWLSFYPLDQETYLAICAHWLTTLGGDCSDSHWQEDALRWALERGSRSGRIAWHFARDACGRLPESNPETP